MKQLWKHKSLVKFYRYQNNLIKELSSEFRKFVKMFKNDFKILLQIIYYPKIEKKKNTNFRVLIFASIRLAVILRYLTYKKFTY